jgi:hypothetical protein
MKMDRVPEGLTMVAFLKSKGWKEQKRDQHICELLPPQELQTAEHFTYSIPLDESRADYPEYAVRIAFSIADLYQLSKWDLLDLFSRRIEEIQQDIVLWQELLAHA